MAGGQGDSRDSVGHAVITIASGRESALLNLPCTKPGDTFPSCPRGSGAPSIPASLLTTGPI